MALEDRDIFQAICARFADQPIEFIMEQYEKAKTLNRQIEQRSGTAFGASSVTDPGCVTVVEEFEPVPELAPKKRYTKRSLKVKPQDAITDNAIFCCICGAERQTITARHLATHDISVEDYKRLCGYPADMPLMSHKRLAKSKEVIARAQQARLEKKAAAEDY